MKNFHITARDRSIIVRADSDRYGKNAIVYQDISFMNCFNYIQRVTGKKHFQIKFLSASAPYTDVDGRTMGSHMWIEFPA